jgi:hypothetical protein
MIDVGNKKPMKYWGNYTVEKKVQLTKQVQCSCGEKGKAQFNPVFVKIEWDKPPAVDKHEFWFRYWITFEGQKEKYGQFAPIMNEDTLSELLQKAINDNFFSKSFLKRLNNTISTKLNTS